VSLLLLDPRPCVFEQIRIWPFHTVGSVSKSRASFSRSDITPASTPKRRWSAWKAQRDSAKVHYFPPESSEPFRFPLLFFRNSNRRRNPSIARKDRAAGRAVRVHLESGKLDVMVQTENVGGEGQAQSPNSEPHKSKTCILNLNP